MSVPWRNIFCSVPVWSIVATNFFFFAAMRGVKVILPLYVKEALNTTITEVGIISFQSLKKIIIATFFFYVLKQNGVFSAIPSVGALLLHLIIGPLFDHVRAEQKYSLTAIRKVFHVVGKPFVFYYPFAFIFLIELIRNCWSGDHDVRCYCGRSWAKISDYWIDYCGCIIDRVGPDGRIQLRSDGYCSRICRNFTGNQQYHRIINRFHCSHDCVYPYTKCNFFSLFTHFQNIFEILTSHVVFRKRRKNGTTCLSCLEASSR